MNILVAAFVKDIKKAADPARLGSYKFWKFFCLQALHMIE